MSDDFPWPCGAAASRSASEFVAVRPGSGRRSERAFEILMWIRTRDHKRVAAISDLSEEDAMVLAMFTDKVRLSEQEAMVLAVVADETPVRLLVRGTGHSSFSDS
jgi:hypothetical protein